MLSAGLVAVRCLVVRDVLMVEARYPGILPTALSASLVLFKSPVGLPDAFWHCVVEEALIVRVDLAWVAGYGMMSLALFSLLVPGAGLYQMHWAFVPDPGYRLTMCIHPRAPVGHAMRVCLRKQVLLHWGCGRRPSQCPLESYLPDVVFVVGLLVLVFATLALAIVVITAVVVVLFLLAMDAFSVACSVVGDFAKPAQDLVKAAGVHWVHLVLAPDTVNDTGGMPHRLKAISRSRL
ncbi:hypothetical protein B0H13DRAFT_2370286 [Mycena leptocephala]|nr:hypothetical protein B0H13DRAFT_2370286 [Mycena leptocephala]